jgi:hypothetical protein
MNPQLFFTVIGLVFSCLLLLVWLTIKGYNECEEADTLLDSDDVVPRLDYCISLVIPPRRKDADLPGSLIAFSGELLGASGPIGAHLRGGVPLFDRNECTLRITARGMHEDELQILASWIDATSALLQTADRGSATLYVFDDGALRTRTYWLTEVLPLAVRTLGPCPDMYGMYSDIEIVFRVHWSASLLQKLEASRPRGKTATTPQLVPA